MNIIIQPSAKRGLKKLDKNVIELIDTAGVRRKHNVDTNLESLMVTNALQAAKRAHIVLLVIDVQEPELTAQELKLTSYAFDNGAAVIVLFNKNDLLLAIEEFQARQRRFGPPGQNLASPVTSS